jgi:hypothetical protein
MSEYSSPITHLGIVNSIINVNDFEANNATNILTEGTADARYMKSSSGIATGPQSFNSTVTFSSTETHNGYATFSNYITVPSISLSSNIISQNSTQIGYYQSFTSAISGGSISNGGISSGTFTTISLASGVWMVTYYFNITCSASLTFSQVMHGISSSSSTFQQATTQSSSASETLPISNSKYISGTYIFRPSSTTSIYALLQIAYSTAGVVTSQVGISAIRVA